MPKKKAGDSKGNDPSASPLRYLNIGPRSGWTGKMHSTMAGALGVHNAAKKLGLTHDFTVYVLNKRSKPQVEPDPDTGYMRLVYTLVPYEVAAAGEGVKAAKAPATEPPAVEKPTRPTPNPYVSDVDTPPGR